MGSCLFLFMFHLLAVNPCFLRFFLFTSSSFLSVLPFPWWSCQISPVSLPNFLSVQPFSPKALCFFIPLPLILFFTCSSLTFFLLPRSPYGPPFGSKHFILGFVVFWFTSPSLVEPCLSYTRLVFFRFRLFVFFFHYLFVICMEMRYPVF